MTLFIVARFPLGIVG